MTQFFRGESGVLVPFAPHVLLRRYVELDTQSSVGMEGRYRLQVRRADGSLKSDTDWFKNIITNAGLNRLGTGAAGTTCVIGTGATAPTVNDGGLQALAASTTNIQSTVLANSGEPDFYISHTRTFRFNLGALNGNYAEVGVGWDSAALFSRALILNGEGAPTPITVLADEQLDVIYQLRTYMPMTDWGGVLNISGTSTTVVGRRANRGSLGGGSGSGGPLGWEVLPWGADAVFAFSGSIGSVDAAPSGSLYGLISTAGSATWTPAAYSNNSNQRQASITVGLDYANVPGGIGSLYGGGSATSGHSFLVQYGFTPPIPKDATKTLTLTAAISWARRP